ncbi:MAG TPA: Npt1/Npt2 family nucleotide transporter [Candidatus Eisenbacteria bacterium]|jgi:AAA family ATP:ADP antiporter|nr:Npt1/Npt2 family nucleotide transporter [Candidatus Eisenbacteria bacterium]
MSNAAVPGSASTADRRNRSFVDPLLGVFADVRAGEGPTALLLMLNIFLILAAYYLLKTIREPLILTSAGGAEAKSYAAAAIAGLLIILVPVYSALASRVPRVRLINGVTLFFIACLVAFFVIHSIGYDVGVAFFIWVGIFNLMIIAQLWAFANDVYTVDQGKRLFAIVGVGASLGAIAGSFFTGKLVARFGPYPFMIGAAVLLVLCMVLTNVIDRRERSEAAGGEGVTEGDLKAGEPVKGRSGFALVFSNRYLLLIAFLMLVYNLVNTTGEYILGKTVISLYAAQHPGMAGGMDEKKVIGEFYGNYFTWVNIISALIQAFLVSRILKYLGVRVALLILPIVAFGGYLTMAFVPLLALIRGVKITENSLDYSVQSTTKNALYLPTSREAKYKAKQANDTFFVRFGDVVSAGLVFAGTTWLHFAPRQFALANVVLILIWIVLAIAIGRHFQQMSKAT